MGAILATPVKNAQNDIAVEQNNNSIPNEKPKSAPFSKFNIVQECFPALAGKENKFFNEKVPAYWSRTKSESKKKTKNKFPDLFTHDNGHKPGHQPIQVITDFDCKTKLNLPKTPNSHNKHIYGTLTLSESLKYIGCYVYLRCRNLEGLKPSIVVGWIRGIDRSLVLSGWQEMAFISQPNMMVVYMLLREVIPPKVRSISQLKAIMMSTLYMCYAYNGHEISYPLKPFLVDHDRAGFWSRCMDIINNNSDKMLRINKDPKYYNDIQHELKTFGRSLERKDR